VRLQMRLKSAEASDDARIFPTVATRQSKGTVLISRRLRPQLPFRMALVVGATRSFLRSLRKYTRARTATCPSRRWRTTGDDHMSDAHQRGETFSPSSQTSALTIEWSVGRCRRQIKPAGCSRILLTGRGDLLSSWARRPEGHRTGSWCWQTAGSCKPPARGAFLIAGARCPT